MKHNKMYFPIDAIARHEDFDVWYSDGTLALRFEGPWQSEKDRIAVIGRLGGQIAMIKPDNLALSYYLKYERWECEFHAVHIFKHYFVEGRAWNIIGSMRKLPLDFVNVNTGKKDVHVRKTNFRDKGECVEVTARDLAILRLAVQTMVAMGIKEEYKGLSDGELGENDTRSLMKKVLDFFSPKGVPYDQLYDEDGNDLVEWVPGDMSKGPRKR